MINTVLFDLGNVILPFDVTRLAGRLSAYCGLGATDIVNNLWSDYIAHHFETGKMSPEEYFAHISELCQFKGLTYDEFVPIFNEIFEENQEVVEIIANLKRTYRLGLISNTNAIHVPYILATYPSMSHFERHWWSNEAGLRKPDPAIYRLALTHFNIQPHEAVFIDDLDVNIAAARDLGLHGIVYQNADALRNELSKLGVNC